MKRTRPLTVFLTLLALVAPLAAAQDRFQPIPGKWRFDPTIGIEGMASIRGENFTWMGIECANGGAPSISLGSVEWQKSGAKSDLITLDFDIDGRRFTEKFRCYPEEDTCLSEGFPSHGVIEALRRGNQVLVRHDSKTIFRFSLVGSDAAIGRLVGCLAPW